MHVDSTTEDADRLWADGDRRGALLLLRRMVEAAPEDTARRLALVERYRSMGHPDQAGRWAIGLPGVATLVERDRAARLLASSGVARQDLRAFLVLPGDGDLPSELVELLPDVDRYRTLMDVPARARKSPDLAESLFLVAGGLTALAFVLRVVGDLLPSLVVAAHWAGFAATVGIATASAVQVRSRLVERQWGSAAAWVVIAVAVLALAALLVGQTLGDW
ncbi:hypothetical protein HUN59_04085 [Curtobacterium sp. Csp2]|uniref:hypothetical protein n=1 Tax=Curtobacterium sp. Csp2 TaxID=2495430 RepID=UPI0015801AF1|nr:hypothetical protein [Curtobacterium sp. Csp2]QKS15504.1 hypothetical protein HUN59_04085 [Curtobacterium sp. Csp2]